MKKTAYQKPTMRVIELKQRTHILAGSPYGLNNQLIEEETEESW